MAAKTNNLQVEHVPLDQLRPDPTNPRHIPQAELEALTRSISEFGLVDPIIARAEDKTVIGGHQRLLAARKLGLKTVPVIFLDISKEKARLLNVALNKIRGDFDHELLARLLADLSETPELDLTLTGFDDKEIKQLLKGLEAREKTRPAGDLRLRRRPEEGIREPTSQTWRLLPARRAPGALRRCDKERGHPAADEWLHSRYGLHRSPLQRLSG